MSAAETGPRVDGTQRSRKQGMGGGISIAGMGIAGGIDRIPTVRLARLKANVARVTGT